MRVMVRGSVSGGQGVKPSKRREFLEPLTQARLYSRRGTFLPCQSYGRALP
jgi:hypothetical protein